MRDRSFPPGAITCGTLPGSLAVTVVVIVIAAGIVAVAAYLLMLIEFSRRRSTERLLRESQLRFGLLIDEALDFSLVVLDASGRMVDLEPGGEADVRIHAGEVSAPALLRHFLVNDSGNRMLRDKKNWKIKKQNLFSNW